MSSPTGRLSRGIPSLQYLRQQGNSELQIHEMLLAECKRRGMTLIEMDYGQLEQRILANMDKEDPHD